MTRASRSNIILVDTRQQRGKHDTKHRLLEDDGYVLISTTLKWGDYSVPPSFSAMSDGIYAVRPESVSIDTKQSIYELAANIGAEHERFRKECQAAKDYGCQLIIAVANDEGVRSLDDLSTWTESTAHLRQRQAKAKADLTPYSGKTIRKTCETMRERYGTIFLFCSEEEAADLINRMAGGEPWTNSDVRQSSMRGEAGL